MAWVGRSTAPFTQWNWSEAEYQVGGPNFIQIPDGRSWIAGGRRYPGGAKMYLATLNVDAIGAKPREGEGRTELYRQRLELPSSGDCSYPGLVWFENQLWVSYYSSHEGKSSIYLARVDLQE